MKYLTADIIAEITNGKYVGEQSDRHIEIMGAARDNREVKPGNLFVCIRGTRVDGHSFANSAFEAGAVCCLAEIDIPDAKGPYVLVPSTLEAIKTIGGYYRSLFSIPVIGISGSVGKTTTKEMTAAVLGSKYSVLKTPENLNNELGVPLTLLSLNESHEAAVIEMGISDFGEMSRLAEMVKPDVCILTTIGHSHLETLGSPKGVLKAKSEVFDFMQATGTAILNGDDELLRNFEPGMDKILFGYEDHNDIRAENIVSAGTEKLSFDIVCESWRIEACISSYGLHLPMAALAAAAAGRLLGLSSDEILQGLSSYEPIDGRAKVTDTGYITLIDDCYNANPNSVKSALSSLSALSNRKVAILGDMLDLGEMSQQLHREIGEFAAGNGVDLLLCHGENAAFIYESFISSKGTFGKYFQKKEDLIAAIPEQIKKGDAVLVKASHSMSFDEFLPALNGLE